MNSVKKIIWYLIRKLGLGFIVLRFYPKSILRNDGWFNSFNKNLPIDKFNNPIPWYTYPIIKFLEERLSPQFRVFEFGCGYSTAWYSKRVKQVYSVESNLQWANKIKNQFNLNTIVYANNTENYVNEIFQHGLFDIIVIDGIERTKCLEPAMKSLTPTGIIIWDNSDREDLLLCKEILFKQGFKEIKFYGMTPSTFVYSWTSIFYRKNNIFDI